MTPGLEKTNQALGFPSLRELAGGAATEVVDFTDAARVRWWRPVCKGQATACCRSPMHSSPCRRSPGSRAPRVGHDEIARHAARVADEPSLTPSTSADARDGGHRNGGAHRRR